MDFSVYDVLIGKWYKTDLLYGLSVTLNMWITREMLSKSFIEWRQ